MYQGFEDLWIWKEAQALIVEIYKLTEKFPVEEKFNRIQQIRRSAASIADNIAEGHQAYYYNEKIRFLYIARRSQAETKNHIMTSKILGLINSEKESELLRRYNKLGRGINNYINFIRDQSSHSQDSGNT